MLNPAVDPPMTPTAYMQQQMVLRALEDVPAGARWCQSVARTSAHMGDPTSVQTGVTTSARSGGHAGERSA